MKTNSKILLALLLPIFATLLFLPTTSAQNPAPPIAPIILTDDRGEYPVGRNLEILLDPSGQLTLEQVSSAEYALRFTPSQSDTPNLGFTSAAVWVRFKVKNEANWATEWRLVLAEPQMNHINLYLPQSNQPGHNLKQAGRLWPFTSREVPYHQFVFTLALPPQLEQTIYLRFQTETTMYLPLTLWSLSAFSHHAQMELLMLGLFYGALLIIMGYNLWLFLALNDFNYLYLGLFIAALSLNQGAIDGLTQQYLWPNWRNPFNYEFFGPLALVLGLQFTASFLETKRHMPKLHKTIYWLIGLTSLVFILNFFIAFPIGVVISALICIPVAILAGFAIWRQGYHPARYYLIAWLALLGTGLSFVLASFGLVGGNILIVGSLFRASVAGMVLLFSLAQVDRVNLLKTEAEQASRHLAASERRLNQYLEAMPLGVIVHDPASKPQYLNQLALQIFNLADKQENLKPNVARPLQETTQQYPLYLAETSQPYPFERLPVVQALGGQKATANDLEVDIGGRRVSLEVSAAPIFNEQGQVQYAISAFQDISERKKAEVALRHSEMQLQLALKAGQLGIWNWDIVTNKVQWSAEVETIFGLPPGAFAGTYHAYLELLHPEDQPQVAQRIQQALDRMEDYRIEHRVLLPNGAVRWLAGQGKVLGDETGHPIRMVGTVQDITERKQLEERLAAIYHLGQELTLLHDETAVARQVLDTALPMLRAEAAGYAVVDEAAGELVYWFHGPGITLLSPYLRLPLNGPQGLEVAVVHSGQPLNISDTSQEARYVAGPGDWIGGSALYAPLKIGQNVSGVLVVESLASNHFTPADQLIFQTLADQAAVAIENARLFEQVQTYSAELEQRVAARTAELQQVNQQLQQEIAERQRAEEAYQVLVENSLQGFAIFQDDRVVFANSKVAQEFTGYTLEELKTMTPNQINELVHPEDQALVQAHVEDRLKEKRLPPNYEFRIICKDGQVRWLEIFATLAEYRGRPAIQAAYIDITERKQAEAKIRRQNEYLNTLYQITLDLLNRRHVDDLLQTILIRATELLDATYGEILQLEGEALVTRICTPNQAFLRGDRIQRGEGLLSWRAFDTGQPILLDDYATWPERRAVYNPVELHATLDIPIMVGQNCLGVVALGRDRLGYVFDSEQLRVGLLFAQLAGLVLDNAHWRVQAEQAAVAMERNRLAQDLHDAVTQSLFSASVIAEALPRIWEQHPGEARHGLEELRLLTRGALAEMRSLLLELRPAGLVENKLGDLLAHLTEAFRSRTRLPITLTVTGHYSLPPEVQIIFYYFAQEALNNIAKHAAASQIILELLLEADSIRLSICDDGCGFNPENIPPGHLGLLIMRERANKIGATLTIQSQLGQGTQLHLWLATASFPSVVSSKNGEWRT